MRTFIVLSLTMLLLVFVYNTSAFQLDRVASLEEALNATRHGEPLRLRLGKEFTEPLGAVIFLSKKQGMERMVMLARTSEPELAMLYLPCCEAWITITKSRELYKTISDHRYVTAALKSKLGYVELWHTHNNESDQKDLSEMARETLSRMWIMPSDTDFLQLYEYAREVGKSPVGVVANIYGTTTYWSDDPAFGLLLYQRHFVRIEAEQLRNWAEVTSPSKMSKVARAHRGFMKLRFKLVK